MTPSLQQLDDAWKYAILGGVASLPFTAASYWQTGSKVSLVSVFGGGLLAGYFLTRNTGTRDHVGARAGLIGGLPILVMLFDMLRFTFESSNPLWFSVTAVLMTLALAVLSFGLAALTGELGAIVGNKLAKRKGPRHRLA